MFALVKTTYDRKTGKMIKTEVIEEVDMSEDEYYRPLVEILTPRIMKEFKNEEASKNVGII